MATKVTIQDIASELQLSRNTVSKAINNTGVLADATREKILRKAAEMGYKQFAYLPLFQEDAAKQRLSFCRVTNGDRHADDPVSEQLPLFLHDAGSFPVGNRPSAQRHDHSSHFSHRTEREKLPSSLNIQRTAGIICFEVFDYDYAQMLCDLDVPLLFVDTPVMEMRPSLKADRLYMENRTEIQNAVAHMVQRGKNASALRG